MTRAVLALALLTTACATPDPDPHTLKLVTDLTILAHARPPGPAHARDVASALDDGRLDLDTFIEQLLDAHRLGRKAKDVILTPAGVVKDGQPVPRRTLKTFEEDGETIYTVGSQCTLDDVEEVRPWWSRKKAVKVCAHAHRPEVRTSEDGRMCGASTMLPGAEEGCGCGPRLMWCVRDEDQRKAMLGSLRAEVDETVAYVVNKDLPLEQLFLMNATVRNRHVETIYRRSAVAAGADPKLLDARGFTSDNRLAPRDELVEGQHAGILTSAGLIFSSDALRGVMREYYGHIWCARTSSSGVTTERVLGLDVVDLRVGDGWQQLAAMDICTDCHARLDYGMQFFAGYPSSTMGVDFRPDKALPGTGPLYGAHIGDDRGSDLLTPQGFARIALSQPEFGECMAEKVVGHVLGDSATPDDRDAVLLAFEDEHTYKAMMRVALHRFADHARAAPMDGSTPERAPRPGLQDDGDEVIPEDAVALSADLVRAVDNHCAHCHDGIDQVDLTGSHLTRPMVGLMLEKVAFGAMPIGPSEFADTDRKAFVEAAVHSLWTAPDARAEALAFFEDGRLAHPAHGFHAAKSAVVSASGGSPERPVRSLQISVAPKDRFYTPGLAAISGMVGLDACKNAGHTGAELEACVLEATDPKRVIAGSVD